MRDYLVSATVELGDVSAVGTGSSGVDGVVRQLQFTLRNDGSMLPSWDEATAADETYVVGDEAQVVGDELDGAELLLNLLFGTDNEWTRESFAPRDKTSSWNQMGGNWVPLLWPYREVVLKVAITAPGATPQPSDWVTLFHGYLGDSIRTSGATIECQARDLAKRLQDVFIDETRTYGSPSGVPMETVIQQMLDDHLGPGQAQLYCPVSPGFMVIPWDVEDGSLWDKLQELVSRIGWFLGFRWDAATGQMRLTLMEPPRTKNASTADFQLNWEDDIYAQDLDITDADVRNVVTVTYRDEATGKPARVTVQDNASIAEFGRRAMRIGEADTSLISTQAEALRLANAALADLKDLTATTKLDMPLLPTMDVFAGIVVTDPRVSSTDDFYGVESVRHTLDFEGGRFRTEVIASGRVIGAHTRWLAMQTRPGAGLPVKGRDIESGVVIPAPTGLSVAQSGLEQVGQDTQAFVVLSWQRPTGYYPDRYRLQVQRQGGDWSRPQEWVLPETQQRLLLPGNVSYDARVAAITKEGVQGAWSATLAFTTPADEDEPATPTGLTVTSAIRGLTVTHNANSEPDLAGYEVHLSTVSGFTPDRTNWTTLKAKGNATRWDLIDLTPGQTYYVRVLAYDTSGNVSAPTAEVSALAGQAQDSDIGTGISASKITTGILDANLVSVHAGNGSVILDGTGITINNGKLTIRDANGQIAMDSRGLQGWVAITKPASSYDELTYRIDQAATIGTNSTAYVLAGTDVWDRFGPTVYMEDVRHRWYLRNDADPLTTGDANGFVKIYVGDGTAWTLLLTTSEIAASPQSNTVQDTDIDLSAYSQPKILVDYYLKAVPGYWCYAENRHVLTNTTVVNRRLP